LNRRGRTLVTAAVVGAVVAPVALDADGFPLSTYPMYSRLRSTEVEFVTAQAVDPHGARSRLSLGVIGASDDPLIVAGELRATIRAGRADDRCAAIAERWRAARAANEPGTIDVVSEVHDVVRLATGDDSLLERTVHARCEADG